jgi:hypothetical protein
MALLPFYLPKRICDLFFRSKRLFSEKSFVNSQGIFRFIKGSDSALADFLQIIFNSDRKSEGQTRLGS